MATLSVLKFETPDGAEHALTTIQDLARKQLIKLLDAAVLTWPTGKKKPKTHQLHNVAAAGAFGGAFWGMLFGILFFVPLLGMALGAAMGALSGSLRDVGINDNFIRDCRDKITEGTSALFLMTTDAVQDKVIAAMKQHKFEIVTTNLSKEQEDALREAFQEEEAAAAV
jgi:uncharacterized membrane protein